MCWKHLTLNNEIEPEIAQYDIPVFKVCCVHYCPNGIKLVIPYYYPCSGVSSYKIGETYKLDGGITISRGFGASSYVFTVDEGFHSYSINRLELRGNGADIEIAVRGACAWRANTTYFAKDLAIVLCVIPKGSNYLINSAGEVVSDALKVKELLIKPFTFKPNGHIFVESVEQVNNRLVSFEVER